VRALIRALACAAALLGGLADAAAQPDDIRIRNATAKLTASGVLDPNRALPGQEGVQRSHGTGIVVSEDGFILTTYHLIEKLGAVFDDSIKITAQVGGQGQDLTAFVVDASDNIDLLLLKVQLSGPYDHFPLGSAYDVGNAPVHTYGYPAEGEHDVTDTSRITSRTVEGGYLWGTDFNLAEGQSGSPVYNDEGEVVAIAKGEVNDRGAIIPIDYADTLIGFMRLRKALQEVQSETPRCRVCFKQAPLANCLGALQSCSDWSATHSGTAATAPGPAEDEGWSEGITLRAGGSPASDSDSCEVQWKIECE
jgi:S1-C subfamily serine protease